MIKVDNKHNVELYCEIEEDIRRVVIYDSTKKFMNDLYFDDDEESQSIIEDLENTTLEDLCNFMWFDMYDSIEELAGVFNNQDIQCVEDIIDHEYVNIFYVNGKPKYCIYEG